MSQNQLPDPPVQLRAIQSYMKIASDIERVDPVVAYWVRLFSTETALYIDRDSPECKAFLSSIILWLEKFKQTHKDNEAVTNQTVGQAHMENFAVALFTKADTLDRDGTANKNTVKMFFMAAILFEAMAVFGALTEEISKRAKYAKFKAAYIQKCLRTGQTPKPGPVDGSDLEGTTSETTGDDSNSSSKPAVQPQPHDELPADDSSAKKDPFILTPSSVVPGYPPSSAHPQVSPPIKATPDIQVPQYPPAGTPNISLITTPTTTQTKSTIQATKFQALNGAPLTAEDLIKSQKFCKFANSALQYDDIQTAVSNLEKALKLLKTGENSE